MILLRLKILFVFICITSALAAQNCITLRYFGLTVHPGGDQTAQLQPYKIDKHAIIVANFGGFILVDHYIKRDVVAITFMQGCFTDCSAGFGGFTHVGLRFRLIDKGKHRILLGVGPMFYYRRDWNRFAEYHDSGYFHRYHSSHIGAIQYKFFPLAGEFAYHWEFSKHFDFNFGFTPGLPIALSFSAGLTWWPERFTEKAPIVKVHLRKKNDFRLSDYRFQMKNSI
jgi:hypothetical protein